MSNRRRLKTRASRNLEVLMARFHAEVQAHGEGGYVGDVRHDPGCPGLARQSMLACTCSPEVVFKKVA